MSELPELPTAAELKVEEQQRILNGEQSVGMFRVRTANKTIQDAALRPDPKRLWFSLWYEHETCVFFADSNIGKSVYAVQIASSIAEHQKVLYFDFELSDKQFQKRYSDESGHLHTFPENLLRVEVNPELLEIGQDFEKNVIKNIEDICLSTNAEVVVVDNVTWLCNASEKGEAAGTLMKALLGLKTKYGWSILVLAHTPKRDMSRPITQNDLAGSKRLFNLFDSAFSIGWSAKDENLRYIKQLKIRSGSLEFGSENVILCCIEKTGSFLHFRHMGYASEREHLKEPNSKERSALIDAIVRLKSEGKTYRDISSDLKISIATISRLLHTK